MGYELYQPFDSSAVSPEILHGLILFRDLYSNKLKMYIAFHAPEWEGVTDEMLSSDRYVSNASVNDAWNKFVTYNDSIKATKPSIVNELKHDIFDRMLKLPFDEPESMIQLVEYAYSAYNKLKSTSEFILLKVYLNLFFKYILKNAIIGYEYYKNAVSSTILGSPIGYETRINIARIYSAVHLNNVNPVLAGIGITEIVKYINNEIAGSATIDKGKLYEMLIQWYKAEVSPEFSDKCKDTIDSIENKCDGKLGSLNNLDYLNDLIKDNGGGYDVSYDEVRMGISNAIADDIISINSGETIIGDTLFNNSARNRSKFLSMVDQTANYLENNENADFIIDNDFVMYLAVNKDDYRFDYITYNDFTKAPKIVLEYNGVLYLLYQIKDDENLYGAALTFGEVEPSQIIRIEPDDHGKFKFVLAL